MASTQEDSARSSGQIGRLFFSTPALAFVVAIASLLISGFNFRLARNTSETQAQTDPADVLRLDSRIWQDPKQLLPPAKLRDQGFLSSVYSASETNWETVGKDLLAGPPEQTNAV